MQQGGLNLAELLWKLEANCAEVGSAISCDLLEHVIQTRVEVQMGEM